MQKRYVLNATIEFSPEEHQLSVRGTGNPVIKLNAPVSRCLELLIERRYSLVPQQVFYSYVWGDAGAQVTANTLYQNIGLLRKALKTLMAGGDNIVTTVPKKGFALHQDVTVQELESDNLLEYGPPTPIISAVEDVVAVELTLPSADTFPSMKKVQKVSRWRAYILPVVAMVLLGLFLVQLMLWGTPSPSFTLSSFVKKGTVSGCHLYANSDREDINVFEKAIKEKWLDCKETPYAYSTSYQYGSQSSILACDHPLEGTVSPECISYVMLEDGK